MDFHTQKTPENSSQKCPDILLLMDLALGKHPPGVKKHANKCAICRGKLELYRSTLRTPELEYEYHSLDQR